MRRLLIATWVLGVLVVSGTAEGALFSRFTTDPTLRNLVKFNNYEIILRADEDGNLTLPAGDFSEVNPALADPSDPDFDPDTDPNLADVGDYVVQILTATTVQWLDDDSNIVASSSLGLSGSGVPEITAYALQRITSRAIDIDIVGNLEIEYLYGGANIDPFQVFGTGALVGEAAMVMFDENPDGTSSHWFTSDGDGGANRALKLGKDVSNASDGAHFATFGFASPSSDGMVSGTALIMSDGTILAQQATGGLNLMALGAPYSQITFPGVVNPVNFQINSMNLLTDVELSTGNPWRFFSNDPWKFRMTPEPGSLVALMGLALMGMVGYLYRRFRTR